MPRVCPRALVMVLIACAVGPETSARAGEMQRHMGLYVARPSSARPSAPPTPAEVPLVSSSIEATARGPLVEVVSRQRFTNRGKHTIEAVYVFPLPATASVSAFSIRHGAKTIRAEIVPRAQAVQRYEAAVKAGVVGAMLEAERPDVFTQAITGIAAGDTIDVEVRWDAIATRTGGVWELAVPLVVAPRYVPGTPTGAHVSGSGRSPDTDRARDASRVTPHVRDDGGGVPTKFTLFLDDERVEVTSPSHEVSVKKQRGGTTIEATDEASQRDLIVRWKTRGGPRAWLEREASTGFVAVTVEGPAAGSKRGAIRAAVALVPSAQGGEAAMMARRIEREVLAAVDRRDRIATRAADGSYGWKPGSAARAGEGWPGGDLAVALGALKAPGKSAAGGASEVVLVTDGLVADDAAVIAAARALGRPVHVVGVGAAPNRALCAAIATATNGTVRFADSTADLAKLARELVADVASTGSVPAIDWGGLEVTDVVPATLPRLGAGQAITVFARTAKPRATSGKVSGKIAGAAFVVGTSGRSPAVSAPTTSHGPIARLWARGRVAELVAARAAPAEVSRVAMTYGVLSSETALVAVGVEVVDRAGTRRSVPVPVALPIGMRQGQVFDFSGKDLAGGVKTDAKEQAVRKAEAEREGRARDRDGVDGARRPAKPKPGTGKAPVAKEPPVEKPAPTTAAPEPPPARTRDGGGAGGGGGGDVSADSAPSSGSAPMVDQGSTSTAAVEPEGEEDDASAEKYERNAPQPAPDATVASGEVLARHRSVLGRRFGLSLRAAGGVEVDADARGMGAIGAGVTARLTNRLEAGLDLSLWIVGRDTDVAFRTLVTTGVLGLARGWADLTFGVGLHLADDPGVGFGAGLRLGRGRIGPVLRYDGGILRDDAGDLRAINAVDLGIQVNF